MSIDPIQLLANIASVSGTSTSSTSASGSTSSGSGASSPLATSAFILDGNLASLDEQGAKGLSGMALAGYNRQALAVQNMQSMVGSIPAGDSTTSSILSSLGNLQAMQTMQAAGNAESVSVQSGPDVLQSIQGTSATSQAATTAGAASPAFIPDMVAFVNGSGPSTGASA
jgi:hypothetical protein